MSDLIDNTGGRKFVAFMTGLAAVGIQYTAMSIIIGKEFATANFGNFILGVGSLVGIYITGNAVVNFSKSG